MNRHLALTLFLAAGQLAGLSGCGSQPTVAVVPVVADETSPEAVSDQTRQQIAQFCGDCHALPRPQSFARDRWHFEVRRGYEFYAKSGRTDLDVPPLEDTLRWYRSQAPEQLEFPQPVEDRSALPITFEQEGIAVDLGIAARPEVADLKWGKLSPGEDPVLLVSDLRHGQVVAVDLRSQAREPRQVLARLRNPGRLVISDLDDDELAEILVADLGSYLPAEHDRGRLMLLRRTARDSPFETIELFGNLARVADVQVADLDGDSRQDLVIAVFGWRDTGQLLWARNVSEPAEQLEFELQTIDDRPGCLDVRVHDMTGDGRPDVVALFSQEYETIDLFENQLDQRTSGRPPWVRSSIYAAPDLTFGFTGIELVDLNSDGLIDVLATNGDAFDNEYVTPWHGLQWIENRGDRQFVSHRLTDMPGAYRARTGDFDRDGDLDIVAVSRLPPHAQPHNRPGPTATIILLLQNESGEFGRHTLQSGPASYATVAVDDFDNNGWLDFVVASGPYAEAGDSPALTVWWNQGGER